MTLENANVIFAPKILSSQICKVKPPVPSSSIGWKELHSYHVKRLQSAYGALLSKLGLDGIVIHSGYSHKKNSRDDQYWPVTATPAFTHWTPYQETPALLAVKIETKPMLFVEEHSSYWEGPAPVVNTWDRESFDFETATDLASLRFQGQWAFVGDDLNFAIKIGIPVEQRNRQDVISSIEQFRTLKSEFEVTSILTANIEALIGHKKLSELFHSHEMSELESHYEYLKATQQTDLNVAYNDIVALGKNCGILHHVHYEKTKIMGDTSMLVDAGALCHGYASDITRTWVRGSGEAAEAFRALIRGVDSVQQVLVSEFKVGVPYENLHNLSHKLLAEVLIQIGLANCSAEALVNQGVTRLFFPHGLGHSLGLQVHDVGMRLTTPAANNPYLRNTSVITAGQVVTIEPGLYFIPRLMGELRKGPLAKQINEKLLVQLEPFGGIRIEDNVLATEAGPVNLTR